MSDLQRETIIDSWHQRADAYQSLIDRYPIFTEMAMTLVRWVERSDATVMDLAAGTGLVSRLLLERVQLSPTSLYLIEPASQMCLHARTHLPQTHIYQIAAEDCLSIAELPRESFDFILCNASMHLMSEEKIYPVINKLLKPHTGLFLYTLWYHSFDETESLESNDEFEGYVNQALAFYRYPKYFAKNSSAAERVVRSRKSLAETAEKCGLRLHSCEIHTDRMTMQFDLDFLLMRAEWLDEHLKEYQWTQRGDTHSNKRLIIEKIQELIEGKSSSIGFVRVAVERT